MTDLTFDQAFKAPAPSLPDRLPVLRKFGYGVGCITFSLPHQLLGSIFLLYATVILGISPLWAGALIGASTFWDAISDPLMGHISDRTRSSRHGRRHGYMLIGGILTVIATWLLWSLSPELGQAWKIGLLFTLLIAAKTAQTVFYIPYSALGSELARGYDERTSIQAWRGSFYIAGMLVALVGANMFFFRSTPEFPQGQFNPAAYPAMGLAFALVAGTMALVSYLSTNKYVEALPKAARSSDKTTAVSSTKMLAGALKACVTNRNFAALAVMIFLIEVGFQISIAIGFHVNSFTFGLNGPQIAILGLAVLGSSILSQPFWLWLSKRTDKKPALFIGMVFGLTGFVGLPWTHVWWDVFPMEGETLMYSLAAFNVLGGIGNGAFMTLPFSMVTDTLDQTERETGERPEGIFFGFYNFAYKSGVSISLVLSGLLLSAIGVGVSMEGLDFSALEKLAMAPTWLLLGFAPLIAGALMVYDIKRDDPVPD